MLLIEMTMYFQPDRNKRFHDNFRSIQERFSLYWEIIG